MSEPLDAAQVRLDDYVRAQPRDDDQVAEFEQDLFERALAAAAPELEFRAGLSHALRVMNASGTLEVWLRRDQVDALRASARRVVFFDLDVNNLAPPPIPADAELLITRIPLDLRGVQTLDAELHTEDGIFLKRMPDIGFDPEEGAVYACCEAELARTAMSAISANRVTRVWATRDGERQLLLELRVL